MRETHNSLDWDNVLKKISHLAISATAKDEILTLRPLESPSLALESMDNIKSAESLLASPVLPSLESIDHFALWYSRTKKAAVLKPSELRDVRLLLRDIEDSKQFLKYKSSRWSEQLLNKFMDPKKILQSIDKIITYDGEIRTDASPALKELFETKNSMAQSIQKSLNKLVKDNKMDTTLQDRFVTTREGRWVVPVKSSMRSQIPGIIHDFSQSKETVFVEPEQVVQTNNKLRGVEIDISREVARIMQSISLEIHNFSDELLESQENLINIDIIVAKARFSQSTQSEKIVFNESNIDLINLRHPILTLQLQEKNIANHIQLSEQEKVLSISGPNAGGKTVLLKSIGLAALMSSCGLPVCCDKSSHIPFFKKIIAIIGDTQNVDLNLSTFAGHLHLLKLASEQQGKDNLILVDEICSATDPEEGAALAKSFIATFFQSGVYTVVTSHLTPLRQNWSEHPFVLASMVYDEVNNEPTYKISMNSEGSSYAFKMAQKVNVNEKIIQQALTYMSPDYQKSQSSLEQIEKIKDRLKEAEKNINHQKQLIDKKKKKYERLIQEYHDKVDVWIDDFRTKSEKKVQELIQKIKAEKHVPNLVEIQKYIPNKKNTLNNQNKDLTIEDFKQLCPPGTRVYIPHLKQTAIVQGEINSKGEVPILSNSMRLSLNWQLVELNKTKETPSVKNKSNTYDELPNSSQTTLDIRGYTVDEAISFLDHEMDQALLNQKDKVKIIHGMGTLALKKAVRRYLSKSIYVEKWIHDDNNNEGSTVAILQSHIRN